jgi:integrase
MRIVRNFCIYRRRTERECFVPDSILFPAPHQSVIPYIFSESDVADLLNACPRLSRPSSSPLRPEVLHFAIVLLYTTGLRRGELLRLTVSDIDSRRSTLFIRPSKFHKSRLLPLPQDVMEEVALYLRVRRQHNLPVLPGTPLIWNSVSGGRAYTGTGLHDSLEILLHSCSIRTSAGRLPRVHDFRHSFAVNALIRWYRAGIDVRTKLPFLAAWLGHVSILSTYHYLHFVEPLRSLASSRFADSFGGLVTAGSAQKGAER